MDDAHLNANVTQLDLQNMAVSPREGRATSPTERTSHAVILSSLQELVMRKATRPLTQMMPLRLHSLA